jgi:iron complex outermembrane receptor protein
MQYKNFFWSHTMNLDLKMIIFLFAFLAAFNQSVIAEESERVQTLDTIVVSAQKDDDFVFQTGDVELEETPAFFSLIKRDQFEGKIESLADVIEKEAGVQVNQAGGLGSYSVISLRGSTSEQVMIYLDGILLNEASGGGVDLSNISLSDVESIEIYRGISPANFGKASIGGVVNIKTLRNKQTLAGHISVGKASFDTNLTSAYINNTLEKIDYILSAEYLRSENDFSFINKYMIPKSPEDWTDEHRNNAALRQYNFLGKMGYDFTDTARLTFVNQWFSKDQGITRRNNLQSSTRFDTDRNILTTELTMNNLGKYHLNTKSRISYTWKEEDYDDRNNQIGKGEVRTIDKLHGLSANFFTEYLTDNNAFSVILDLKIEDYRSIDEYHRKNPNESNRETYIVGAQDTLYLMDQKLSITPAIRLMRVNNFLFSAKDRFRKQLYSDKRKENFWMPQMGIKYRMLHWLSLKSNIARYVREPSFFELFGDRGYFYGNPELDPEKGNNFDIGLDLNWKLSNAHVSRLTFSGAYFVSNTDDMIIRFFNAAGYSKSKNLSRSRIQGIETSIKIDFLTYFRLHCNYTHQDTENLCDDPVNRDNNGKALSGRLADSFVGKLEAQWQTCRIFFEHIRESGMFYDEAELLAAPVKKVFNAGMVWRYDTFQATFDIKNIGNNQHEEYFRYPLPGRSYAVSIKYNF